MCLLFLKATDSLSFAQEFHSYAVPFIGSILYRLVSLFISSLFKLKLHSQIVQPTMINMELIVAASHTYSLLKRTSVSFRLCKMITLWLLSATRSKKNSCNQRFERSFGWWSSGIFDVVCTVSCGLYIKSHNDIDVWCCSALCLSVWRDQCHHACRKLR